ncbi:phosphatidate cytidylyltransferase [Thermomonas sp.]|uniref:phosphatidate cytidylyltransferase n=3 Tax=Thermomonas sp. TaxID=1971895 RepID=UPI001B75BC0B|nr:phosphatidate cytidylyltransferase [Thermomonas sp.]HRA38268.1 phosphatidate cytidylyltransferase [Pseudomonadota bacterium]MBK6416967.1 phosphatidate cytidylyltransferase [Thermomonas sp.]MBK6924200.1 phosphatidate cytidylyltransferase [Thermomonas sp.]MBK7204747.1 phosphatidate cytidylyltransferase [Thermomonas sp.]MBK9670287.1 phosphatidate cytidylyltransferase [Thermomonas sp.]
MTKTRLLAALIMAPIAILSVLFVPTPVLAALAALLFLTALWEWLKLAEVDDTLARTILLLCNVAVMAALVWGSRSAQGGSFALLQLVVVVGVAWWLLAMLWMKHYHFASDHDSNARAFKLLAGTLAVVPAWCALGLIHASQPNGHQWLLLALLLVWSADTGAYFAGRHFGGKFFARKLAPRISPNKTIEGLLGGLLLALAVAIAGALLIGARVEQLPAIGVVALATVLFSVVGDLFESLLKRHVGAKDSGDLIPGHGGVLDRVDSVLAALPVFALGKAWLGF